jgi:hypothetical protein
MTAARKRITINRISRNAFNLENLSGSDGHRKVLQAQNDLHVVSYRNYAATFPS